MTALKGTPSGSFRMLWLPPNWVVAFLDGTVAKLTPLMTPLLVCMLNGESEESGLAGAEFDVAQIKLSVAWILAKLNAKDSLDHVGGSRIIRFGVVVLANSGIVELVDVLSDVVTPLVDELCHPTTIVALSMDDPTPSPAQPLSALKT
jgi:hypothetical protein